MKKKIVVFFRDEMRYTKIVGKYASKKWKLYRLLLLSYLFGGFSLPSLIILDKDWLAGCSITFFILFLFDLSSLGREKIGLFYWIDKVWTESDLKALNPYKQKYNIDFQTVSEAIWKIRVSKFRIFCMQNGLNINKMEQLITQIKDMKGNDYHKDKMVMKHIINVFFSGFMVFLGLIFPREWVIGRIGQLIYVEEFTPKLGSELGTMMVLLGLNLVLIVMGCIIFYGMIPRFYFGIKFKMINQLQDFLDDLILTQAHNNEELNLK